MEKDRPRGALPFPASLCHRCGGVRYVKNAQSTFLLCERLKAVDPERKYPRQPVLDCALFEGDPSPC